MGWAGTREGWVGWVGGYGWGGWAGTREGVGGVGAGTREGGGLVQGRGWVVQGRWAGTREGRGGGGWEGVGGEGGGCCKAPQGKEWVAWMTAAARGGG